MKPHVIVGAGEILWDVFPDGPRFGGAPANFACHAAALGGQAYMLSAVGADELGEAAITTLQRHNVAVECVARLQNYPTGTVQVEIDAVGKPQYRFGLNEAWDHLQWSDEIAALAARTDAVCFGTLGQRGEPSRQVIQRFVGAVPRRSFRIFDINLRPPFINEETIDQSLELANVLKLNDEELPVLASKYGLSGSAEDCMSLLAARFDLHLVALSRGERGAVLMQGDVDAGGPKGQVSEFPGVEVAVQDTVGAGDAFTAAMTLGLLSGTSLETINRHACQVAGYVCSQPGATPRLPDELRGPSNG